MKVNEFYLSNLQNMTFIERYYFIVFNFYAIDFYRFKFSLNPLRWCAINVITTIWLFVLIVMWLTIIQVVALIEAKQAKEKYKDKKYIGCLIEDAELLEQSK